MPAPSRADQTLQRNAELCVKPANHRERQVARTIENFIHAIRFTNRRSRSLTVSPCCSMRNLIASIGVGGSMG